MEEKKFSQIFCDYLRYGLKKYIPIFWIPGVGDKLLEKVMNSYAVSFVEKGWVMISLM